MIKADKYYKENLKNILKFGSFDENPRPKYADGTPAYSKYITQVFETYDIARCEFPITTLRNTAIKMGIKEVLWIYQKQSNSLDEARSMGINWWDSWDVGDGTIGERYGYTVKKYNLIEMLLNGLKDNPFSRRHIINLYQENDLLGGRGLYPCAYETLWSVRNCCGNRYLDLTLIQRSNDYIVSGYINKIQYVALQMMVASHLSYEVGTFCHLVQNLHVYDRHSDAITEIIQRKSLDVQPKIWLKEKKKFYDFTVDDFGISGIEDIKKISSKLDLAI